MPGSKAPRKPHDSPPAWHGAAIGAAVLAAALGAMGGARAQDPGSSPGCFAAPLPTPGAASAASGSLAPDGSVGPKFRLITQQCPALADAGTARLAEPLARPERLAPTTVSLTIPGAAEPAGAAAAAMQASPPPVPSEPLGKGGERIVSLAPALLAVARENQLDPLLLHAIAHVESRHNPQAVSPAGARGLMQMMPATAQRFGVSKPETALHDAETNLRASAALLRSLQARYGADLRLVLAAYNAGEGAVAKYGNDVPPYRETQAYVRDVTAVYRRLSYEFTLTAGGSLVARQGS